MSGFLAPANLLLHIPPSLHLLRHLRLDIHDVNLHSVAILTVEV